MMNKIIFAFGLLLSLFSPYVTSDPDAASKNTTRVIIVGAGASGIAAASRLFENGFTNVLVLEAEDRIGGRVYTMDFPGESSVIEIGGQWVHGEKDNVVYELAGPRNLLKSSVVTYLRPIFMQSSAQSIDDKLSNGVMDLFDVIRGEEIDEKIFKSTGDYFVTSVNAAWKNSSLNITEDLKEQFLEWLHQAMNGYDCSDTWFESAATSSYWECEGDHNLAWKENGYRTIFSILTEKSNSILGKSFIDNYIIKNTEVVKITPDNNGVRVKCDNGKEYEADHVIVTVSLGVLKATYSNLFPPKVLPEQKVKAIEYLLIGSVAKLYFKFPHQWWPENISGLGLLWTKEDKEEYKKQGLKWVTDVYHFYAVDNNPTMLCGWVAGQSARDMEKTDKEVVKTQLIQVLKKFFDKKYKIPEPIWFYRTTWKSNPHFRGAYSFVGTISEQMNVSAADLSEPVVNGDKKPIILFAGEATNPHHYSTVHGAIETGRREADRIISLKELPK